MEAGAPPHPKLEFARERPNSQFADLGSSCYKLNTVKQLTVAAIFISALFASAVRLPATICPVASAPIGKACKMGCCASKCCCVDSQKNHDLPSVPAAKDSGSSLELIALSVPALTTLNFSVQPTSLPLFIIAAASS